MEKGLGGVMGELKFPVSKIYFHRLHRLHRLKITLTALELVPFAVDVEIGLRQSPAG